MLLAGSIFLIATPEMIVIQAIVLSVSLLVLAVLTEKRLENGWLAGLLIPEIARLGSQSESESKTYR